jgi:hypothetical protein
VIEGALLVILTLLVFALLRLVYQGVILLFLPPMTLQASSLELAPFLILADESACLPVGAQLWWSVVKQIRLPSEVLPIVRVVTQCLVVVIVEGTPFCFEIKHEEVSIFAHYMDQPALNVAHRMSKRTVLPIVALVQHMREVSAELSLVLLNVVQSFHSIMSQSALVLVRTNICFCFFTQVCFAFT